MYCSSFVNPAYPPSSSTSPGSATILTPTSSLEAGHGGGPQTTFENSVPCTVNGHPISPSGFYNNHLPTHNTYWPPLAYPSNSMPAPSASAASENVEAGPSRTARTRYRFTPFGGDWGYSRAAVESEAGVDTCSNVAVDGGHMDFRDELERRCYLGGLGLPSAGASPEERLLRAINMNHYILVGHIDEAKQENRAAMFDAIKREVGACRQAVNREIRDLKTRFDGLASGSPDPLLSPAPPCAPRCAHQDSRSGCIWGEELKEFIRFRADMDLLKKEHAILMKENVERKELEEIQATELLYQNQNMERMQSTISLLTKEVTSCRDEISNLQKTVQGLQSRHMQNPDLRKAQSIRESARSLLLANGVNPELLSHSQFSDFALQNPVAQQRNIELLKTKQKMSAVGVTNTPASIAAFAADDAKLILRKNGIDPNRLTTAQLASFQAQSPQAQRETVLLYQACLQQNTPVSSTTANGNTTGATTTPTPPSLGGDPRILLERINKHLDELNTERTRASENPAPRNTARGVYSYADAQDQEADADDDECECSLCVRAGMCKSVGVGKRRDEESSDDEREDKKRGKEPEKVLMQGNTQPNKPEAQTTTTIADKLKAHNVNVIAHAMVTNITPTSPILSKWRSAYEGMRQGSQRVMEMKTENGDVIICLVEPSRDLEVREVAKAPLGEEKDQTSEAQEEEEESLSDFLNEKYIPAPQTTPKSILCSSAKIPPFLPLPKKVAFNINPHAQPSSSNSPKPMSEQFNAMKLRQEQSVLDQFHELCSRLSKTYEEMPRVSVGGSRRSERDLRATVEDGEDVDEVAKKESRGGKREGVREGNGGADDEEGR